MKALTCWLQRAHPLSYFGVKGGGASNSRTKVDEAVDRFKCIVFDEERRGNVCILSHDFGFLEADS